MSTTVFGESTAKPPVAIDRQDLVRSLDGLIGSFQRAIAATTDFRIIALSDASDEALEAQLRHFEKALRSINEGLEELGE